MRSVGRARSTSCRDGRTGRRYLPITRANLRPCRSATSCARSFRIRLDRLRDELPCRPFRPQHRHHRPQSHRRHAHRREPASQIAEIQSHRSYRGSMVACSAVSTEAGLDSRSAKSIRRPGRDWRWLMPALRVLVRPDRPDHSTRKRSQTSASVPPASRRSRALFSVVHWRQHVRPLPRRARPAPLCRSHRPRSPILPFAGLWERWKNPEGDEVLIRDRHRVWRQRIEWMIPYHDRMPVLLSGADIDGWLDGTLGQDALKPAAASARMDSVEALQLNRRRG